MEDFYYAGGLLAALDRLRDLLDTACVNVTGGTVAQAIEGATVFSDEVIAPRERPIGTEGGVAVHREESRAGRRGHQAPRRRSRACSSTRDPRSCSRNC